MEIEDHIHKGKLGVLVEGARWGDTEFYGNWLLAASKAEALWKEASCEPDFAKQVDRLCMAVIPDFGIAASFFLMRLRTNSVSFVISLLDDEEQDEFTMMVEMGFFARCGDRYQMAIPVDLTIAKVKAAALRYAETEDDEYLLHPEFLVTATSLSEAFTCQMRLLAVTEFKRDVNLASLPRA